MIVYPYIQVLRLLADLHLVSPPCLAVAVVPPGLQHQAQALQPGPAAFWSRTVFSCHIARRTSLMPALKPAICSAVASWPRYGAWAGAVASGWPSSSLPGWLLNGLLSSLSEED